MPDVLTPHARDDARAARARIRRIFDRRAARFGEVAFLPREIARRMHERLDYIKLARARSMRVAAPARTCRFWRRVLHRPLSPELIFHTVWARGRTAEPRMRRLRGATGSVCLPEACARAVGRSCRRTLQCCRSRR